MTPLVMTALVLAQPGSPAKVRTGLGTKGDIWVGQRVTLVVELLAPGTFAGALEARQIEVDPERYRAEAIGEVYLEDDVLVIKRITVRYSLPVAVERRDDAERVHGFHARFCPVARSLQGATPEDAVATTEGVIARLADRGLAVVPYMLEALSDTRPVVMPSSYPGLSEENRSELTVSHIADKVLEEIFQKISRMSLATTEKERFRIMSGWEQEWRRFCPPFRDSPHAPAGSDR